MSTKLIQRHGLFHKRTYEIIGDELLIENHTLTAGDAARYSIFELSDSTERNFKRAWGWLSVAGCSLLPTFSFAYDAIEIQMMYPLMPAGLFAAASAVFWLMYLEKSYDKVIFTNWKTGQGLFVIWSNKPNKAKFETFYGALVEKIRKTKINPKLSPEQKMEIYAQQLALLVDEQVLTPEEAKKILERKEKTFAKEKANVVSLVPGANS